MTLQFALEFLRFALICFRLLSAKPGKDGQVSYANLKFGDPSTYPKKLLTEKESKKLDCDFEVIDKDLMKIFQDAYLDRLATSIIVYGSKDSFKYKIKGEEYTVDYAQSKAVYDTTIIKDIQHWVNPKIERNEVDSSGIVHEMVSRANFLLSPDGVKGCSLGRVNGQPPIFCPFFFADVMKSIQKVETPLLEVSEMNLCKYKSPV